MICYFLYNTKSEIISSNKENKAFYGKKKAYHSAYFKKPLKKFLMSQQKNHVIYQNRFNFFSPSSTLTSTKFFFSCLLIFTQVTLPTASFGMSGENNTLLKLEDSQIYEKKIS